MITAPPLSDAPIVPVCMSCGRPTTALGRKLMEANVPVRPSHTYCSECEADALAEIEALEAGGPGAG